MKYNNILGILFLMGVIIISACVKQTPDIPEIEKEQPSDQNKCENSGGDWDILPETGEGKCDCEKWAPPNNIGYTYLVGKRLLIDGECVDCISDTQCLIFESCTMHENVCIETKSSCEEGLCEFKISNYGKFSTGGHPESQTHECSNNVCKEIN